MKNTDLIAVAEPEFKVGDLVVYLGVLGDKRHSSEVREIVSVTTSQSGETMYQVRVLGCKGVVVLSLINFDHATPAEIKAGHRLNPSNPGELETLEMIDISPNTVVINESN